MSRVRVVFLGEDPRDPLQIAAADYLARAGRRYDGELVALKPSKRTKGSHDDRVRDAEADVLLGATDACTRVALDPLGKALASSEKFHELLEQLIARGKPVAFLVGGATGLHPRVVASSDRSLSLSSLTLAHRLAVLVLAEQIYRAAEIHRGGPYHK